MAMKKSTKDLINKLFLYVSWDGRQSIKVSLTPKERARLFEALGGEPNW